MSVRYTENDTIIGADTTGITTAGITTIIVSISVIKKIASKPH
jgi:hypothetical protein